MIPFLMRYPEMVEWRRRRGGDDDDEGTGTVGGSPVATVELTPDEQMMAGYRRLREGLAARLLGQVKRASPEFFEALVAELLVAMGYGGSHVDAGRMTGRAGDGGIDEIIKEDRLGLASIYLRARRWEGTVGRPVIRQFAGVLVASLTPRDWATSSTSTWLVRQRNHRRPGRPRRLGSRPGRAARQRRHCPRAA